MWHLHRNPVGKTNALVAIFDNFFEHNFCYRDIFNKLIKITLSIHRTNKSLTNIET